MSVGYAVICHCSITDDHSRVIIHENTSSDYINANYIDVSFNILRLIYTGIQYKTSTYMNVLFSGCCWEKKKMIALSWVNSSVICFSGCYGSDSDEIDKTSSVRHLL
jgi:protein tyrosine phosphatase